jgi:hypothetical protein
MDSSFRIFQNSIPENVLRKAERTREKYRRKFGDDSEKEYHLSMAETPVIGPLWGVRSLTLSDATDTDFGCKSVIVGNIRMGFGHYRISMAMASAARALGYDPVWMDLNSFGTTTCGKVIRYQNDLYSKGSRWSQQSALFNRFFWEPMNSEGFRKLSYNVSDQKVTELMTPVFRDIPRDIPFIATHVWPAQAAVHAGMRHVVNAIPDNWPMALHLAEGAVHAVQTPSAALGYRALRGMDKSRILKPMPKGSVVETGHYIDHELTANLEADCARRTARLTSGKPIRYLLTIGGAGAQQDLYLSILRTLLPEVSAGKAALVLNVGDHLDAWKFLKAKLGSAADGAVEHFNDMDGTFRLADAALDGDLTGVHIFCDEDIFSAVYTTNVLMRLCDVLVTKPSELAFYPVPKLMIRRVGGHEAWGAIRSAEVGDGTYECRTPEEIAGMIRLFQQDPSVILGLCDHILTAKKLGIYDGAYRVVQLACGTEPQGFVPAR